ncbi:MAG: hypothetical protein ACSLFC_12810 [Desulfuromonadales bacterium]
MSTDRPIDDYLADIIEAISDIRSFIAGLDYEGFAADKKKYGVWRNATHRL